jgi:hypothetical protein
MGSLFAPSVPRYNPVTYSQPVTQQKSTPSTLPENPVSETKSDEDIAKDIIKRTTTRGRNSTIQTSYRGVLTPLSSGTITPQRKSLLGE